MSTDFISSRRVREITCTVPYTQTASAKIITLPASSRILDWIINVKTALVTGTTTLDVGTSSDADYFIDGVDVSSVGKASPTLLYPGHETATLTEIYASVGAGNTAGSIDVTCLFSLEIDTPL